MIMTYNILHNNINLDPNEFFQLRSSITCGHEYNLFKAHAQDWSEVTTFFVNATKHWSMHHLLTY